MQSNNNFMFPANQHHSRVKRPLEGWQALFPNQTTTHLDDFLFFLEVFENLIEQAVDKDTAFLGAVKLCYFKVFVNGDPGGY